MHILTTSTGDQTIKVASRRDIVGDLRLEVINKSTRQKFDYTGDFQYQQYLQDPEGAAIKWEGGDLDVSQGDIFLEITNQYDLKEGDYYTFKVIDDEGEVYRDILFCTDQTDFDKYEVGKGDYIVEQTLDNDFIVIGDESGGVTPSPSDVTLCYDTSDMDALTSAFKICDLYCVTIDEVNYDDWYLPSTEEAKEIYPYISVLNNSATRFGYDPYYLPEVTSTPSGPSQTNQYYWTSTENVNSPTFAFVYQKWIYLSPIANLLKDIPENCYLSEVNCGGTYYRTKKARVRPVRFEAGVEGGFFGNLGEKGYGGIIAGSYTLNGVDGALIVSPTEPKPADGYTQWSDLGQATTGVISETDGQANTIAALALGA